jgi:hypothetical protein
MENIMNRPVYPCLAELWPLSEILFFHITLSGQEPKDATFGGMGIAFIPHRLISYLV